MKTRAAVKWSHLTVAGSIGLVAALIALETLARWTVAAVGAAWSTATVIMGLW